MDLAKGETLEVQGSAPDPYLVENHGAYYSCTCPAWQFQKKRVERRTCKHLKSILGAGAEEARTAGVSRREAKPRKRPWSERNSERVVDDEGREYVLED